MSKQNILPKSRLWEQLVRQAKIGALCIYGRPRILSNWSELIDKCIILMPIVEVFQRGLRLAMSGVEGGDNPLRTVLPAIVGEEEGASQEFANIDEASNHIPIVVKLDSG